MHAHAPVATIAVGALQFDMPTDHALFPWIEQGAVWHHLSEAERDTLRPVIVEAVIAYMDAGSASQLDSDTYLANAWFEIGQLADFGGFEGLNERFGYTCTRAFKSPIIALLAAIGVPCHEVVQLIRQHTVNPTDFCVEIECVEG